MSTDPSLLAYLTSLSTLLNLNLKSLFSRRATFSALAAFTFDIATSSKPIPNCSLLLFEVGDISLLPCPIATARPPPPGKHKVHLLPTRTGERKRHASSKDATRTRAGLAMGEGVGQAFPLAQDRSRASPDGSLPQHLRDELIAGRPRPQTRSACGRAQSRGLPGSSGLRERRRELEAAGARAQWRPTPGAGSCAVTIGLPELAATVRPSSLRPRPPYRLRGQICGAQAHSGSAARPPQS